MEIGYRPSANGRADPGEVVWAGGTSRWHAGSGQRGRVPFEDDPTQGKDRPSEVRLNRTVRIPAAGVRREGANLPPEMFATVVAPWKAAQ